MDKEKPHHWNEKVEWLQEQYVIYNIQDIVYQLLKYVSLQDTINFYKNQFDSLNDLITYLEQLDIHSYDFF